MTLRINDEDREFAEGSSLQDCLRLLGVGEGKGVAAAVNGRLVPKTAWAERRLLHGDVLLVIRASQGG